MTTKMKHPRIEEILAHTENLWPYDLVFEQPDDELIMQELVTYRMKNGKVTRQTITRNFYGKDYQDSVTDEVLTR